MSITMLKDISPKRWNWVVCTRVSRMWDYRGGTDEGELRHVDLVLLDAEGTAMYAEIGQDNIKAKKPLLVEGKVFTIKRFRVLKAKSTYRPVDSEYMIDINCHTLIEEKHDYQSDFPLYTYSLTDFGDLASLVGETKSFVHVIALIREVSEPTTVHLRNQPKPTVRREITLRDSNNYEMKLSLWGQRATEFETNEICALGQEEPVIAIFVGMLMKTYKGEHSLSGNTACRWYINPDVPEVQFFLESLQGDFRPIHHVAPPEQALIPQPANAEPQHATLEEMYGISPYEFPPEGFKCTVTFSRADPFISWCFPSCNRCSKTSLAEGTGYKCPHCGCTGYRFKYKICLIGTDGTAEAEFVFFGDMGRRLVRKDVRVLMTSCRSRDSLPSEIASQVSQKYLLAINVTKKCFGKLDRSYELKQIYSGFGRQAAIPVVKKPLPLPPSDNIKAILPTGPSSSLLNSPTEEQFDDAQLNDNSNDTPLPKLSPSFTPLKLKDRPFETGSGQGSKKPRRRLQMPDDLTEENFEKASQDLNDDLEDDLHANFTGGVSSDAFNNLKTRAGSDSS